MTRSVELGQHEEKGLGEMVMIQENNCIYYQDEEKKRFFISKDTQGWDKYQFQTIQHGHIFIIPLTPTLAQPHPQAPPMAHTDNPPNHYTHSPPSNTRRGYPHKNAK